MTFAPLSSARVIVLPLIALIVPTTWFAAGFCAAGCGACRSQAGKARDAVARLKLARLTTAQPAKINDGRFDEYMRPPELVRQGFTISKRPSLHPCLY